MLESGRLREQFSAAVMPICLVLLWPLLRPYDWLNRDAPVYALQAISQAHPQRFANDLFFLFGSQDKFTLLTGLVAPVYEWLGVDHAAALLTVLASLIWWGSCWLLARSIAGPRLAWLSVAVIMATSGWYGGGEVFRYAETYFSARLPAEGLVLLALALQQLRRPAWACAVLAVAFIVHPLMTISGAALFALLQVPTRRWAWLLLSAAIALALVILLAAVAPVGRLQFVDPTWLSILQTRSAFLFPTSWTTADWCRTGAVLATLLVAIPLTDDARIKRVAMATAIVGAGGLLAAIVAGKYAPVALLLQVQPWRALWLASVIANLLVPVAAVSAWRKDAYASASALLLLVAVFSLSATSAVAASAAALFLVSLPRRERLAHGRLVLAGAAAALLLTILFTVMSAVTITRIPAWGGAAGATLEHIRNVLGLTWPGLLIALGVWLLTAAPPTWLRTSTAFLALTAMAGLTTSAVAREFLAEGFAGERHAQFADWRTIIPPGANVLWPTTPGMIWFVLERPSYISVTQLAGVIFSRDLALEGLKRVRFLAGYADTDWLMGDPNLAGTRPAALTAAILHRTCGDRKLGFVVAPEQLNDRAPSHAWPYPSRRIYLYDCADYR